MSYKRIIDFGHGGTGQTTQTAGMDALDPLTSKGDLLTHNGTDSVRLPVSVTNNQALVTDDSTATGLKWSDAGSGTVTSVGITGPSIITWSNSPITTSGTLSGSLVSQASTLFLGGPTSGASATPAFRQVLFADISGTITVAQGGTNTSSYTKGDILVASNTTTLTKLALGSDTQVLTADSTQATGTKWAAVSASVPNLVTKTTTYTATTSDDFILCNSSSNFTITLYAASGNSGRILRIVNINTGEVTIDANASETINGSLTKTLMSQYESLSIVTDGTSWYIW